MIEQPETHCDLFLRVKNHLIERHFRHLRQLSLYDKIRPFSRPLHFQDSMLTITWLIPNTGKILARIQSTWVHRTENWSWKPNNATLIHPPTANVWINYWEKFGLANRVKTKKSCSAGKLLRGFVHSFICLMKKIELKLSFEENWILTDLSQIGFWLGKSDNFKVMRWWERSTSVIYFNW